MKNIITSIFLVILLSLSDFTYAQCVSPWGITPGGSLSPERTSQIGVPFVPCTDGDVTEINFETNVWNSNTTFTFYIEADPGAGFDITNVVGTLFIAPQGRQIFTFTLPTPYPVTTGTTYRVSYSSDKNHRAVSRSGGSGYQSSPFPPGSVRVPAWDINVSIISTAPVPTLSQWGLIVLTLLMGIFATLAFAARTQLQTSGQTISLFSPMSFPFEKNLFARMLAIVLGVTLGLFAVAMMAFGYELTGADIPGVLIASPIAAYLLHLWVRK